MRTVNDSKHYHKLLKKILAALSQQISARAGNIVT